MTNNSEKGNLGDLREVDVLKLISSSWMFSVPVKGYPDYWLSKKINKILNEFVEGLGCILKECGSGTGPKQQPIIAFTVKIEKNAQENVQKIKEYITCNVLPIVWHMWGDCPRDEARTFEKTSSFVFLFKNIYKNYVNVL